MQKKGNKMTLTIIINTMVILLGLYVFFTAIQMKSRGKIANWMCKHVIMTPESDKDGFIKEMFFKTIYLGFIMVIYGIYGLIGDIISTLPKSSWIHLLLILILLAYFYLLAVAKTKYLGIMK